MFKKKGRIILDMLEIWKEGRKLFVPCSPKGV